MKTYENDKIPSLKNLSLEPGEIVMILTKVDSSITADEYFNELMNTKDPN